MGREEIEVKTERYRFVIEGTNDESVAITAKPWNKSATEDDVKLVQEFLGNMGRWEKLVSSATTLLGALGLDKGKTFDYRFGQDKYDIDLGLDTSPFGAIVSGIVRLKELEYNRRAMEGSCFLPVKEIACQIENISKWIDWRDSFLFSLRG